MSLTQHRRPSTAPRFGSLVDCPPPDHLSQVAQQAWDTVVPNLIAAGMLRDVDLIAVEMLCEAYADFAQADLEIKSNYIEVIREDGSRVPMISRYTYKIDQMGNRIHILHPAYAAKREASNAIRAWLNELGMTPAARARIVGSVHGLSAEERGGPGGEGQGAEHVLDDLGADERDAMREILKRRLAADSVIEATPNDVELTRG